ncbi:MarR family winged helix-turn-helix transcriptional regulator [Anatilimnocola sp. NA78]|uniref:MarR family winged helix-turn-helix transcriptional regulator n=1 Tax=Anatilimnocola sp. NA78 TaxID=3415683 RepID=UPI003CE486AC
MPSAITLDDEIIVAIRRISQAVEGYSRYLWQEYGLTAPQLGALRELEKSPMATPGHLAEQLHVSPQTVAGILKRLEQRGLITRARDENDRRSFSLQLSDEGRRLSNEAPSLLRDQFRTELNRLQLWEATQILATLQRVATMMSAEDVDADPYFSPSLGIAEGPDNLASKDSTASNGKSGSSAKNSLRA